ncbi:lipopolysaccharide export system protein LptC [Paenibacillus sp. DS2363]
MDHNNKKEAKEFTSPLLLLFTVHPIQRTLSSNRFK